MLQVEAFLVRAIMTNCYLAYCNEAKVGVIIDPGDFSLRVLERIKELGITVKYILNTHGHIDHIEGNHQFQVETKAKVVAHYQDRELYNQPRLNMSVLSEKVCSVEKPDSFVKDGDIIHVGKCSLKVVHTPGHTKGSICLLSNGILFSGDTLFAGSIGRTDFPGGSYEQMVESLTGRIVPLSDDLRVLPGHGPESTLREEKETNPFLRL
ncbi:MAG TPA: MBL fold metallo-hydrolase [Desulfobacteria bacterium]|nr:MBL fold metallo-hydrolase [Desulfobacteria bacterium]